LLAFLPELCGVVSKRYVLAAADLREEDKLKAVLDAAGADARCPPLHLAPPPNPDCVEAEVNPTCILKCFYFILSHARFNA